MLKKNISQIIGNKIKVENFFYEEDEIYNFCCMCSDLWFRARNLHKKSRSNLQEKRSSHYRDKCKFLTFMAFICLSQYLTNDNI